jgi:hypothetical protein
LPKDSAVVESGNGYNSMNHIRFTYEGQTGGENIQLYGMNFPLDVVGPNLDLAYVEFYLWLNKHAFWSRVLLGKAPPAGTETHHFRFEPVTLRGDSQYNRVQVPVSALFPDEGDPLTTADTLTKFMFGCSPFTDDTTVRIDSVYLRW